MSAKRLIRKGFTLIEYLLVNAQRGDGSWGMATHDECFALLVLRRVAKDLTSSLKSSLNIKDLNSAPK